MKDYLQSLPLWVFVIPYLIHIFSTYYFTKIKFLKEYNNNDLYDIIASNTPNFHNYCEIINVVLLIYFIPFLLNFKTKYLISFFKYVSIIILLRSILNFVTILPSCKKERCNNESYLKYLMGHCNDKIFSGHISIGIILIYLLYKYKLLSKITFTIFIILLLLISLFIILCRWHYTVDVLLAYIITGFIINLSPNL